MRRFPMSVELNGKPVFLVGKGPQIQDKAEKLAPFSPVLIHKVSFTAEDARQNPAMVIVGDTPIPEAEKISRLCREHRIPVNVVDVPRLCSFYFPALITRGDVTVSVATGGSSPEVAACLRRQLEAALPEELEPILAWLTEQKYSLRKRKIMKQAAAAAIAAGRPLTEEELTLLEKQNEATI